MKKRILTAIALSCMAALWVSAQRIAVLCDVHVSEGMRNAEELARAVDEINGDGYDLVVMNGDLTNEGSDAELRYVKGLFDKIRHPLCVVPGNHENTWSQSATQTFVDLWGSDRFVAVVDSLAVVGINCGPYMKMGDGHVKQEDLIWLDHTLDSLVAQSYRVLSMNHYPIRKDDLDNYLDYCSVLNKYPVLAHINGHYHTYMRYQTEGIEGVMLRALADRDGTFGYSIIDVDGDTVRISQKRIGAEPELLYEITANQATSNCSDQSAPAVDVAYDVADKAINVWSDNASIFTRLAFDHERVYFGTSLGEVKALRKADGAIAWTAKVRGPLFGRVSVLSGGLVAVPACDGIFILDAATGERKGFYGSKEGPYVADGLVGEDFYIQGGYKRLERRNGRDGSLVWSYDSIDNYCQGAPVVDGDDVVFGAWDTNLRCLDLGTGQLKWIWNNGKPNNLLGPGNVVPVVTVDKVIIVAPDRYMTALDRATGQQLWRDNSHRYRESLGRSADGTAAYAKTMDGELVAVDATSPDFRELWICDMGLGYEHAPCIVAERDGVIYAGSRRGLLTAVDAATHQVLWQLPLGSSEINGIDIDHTDGSVWLSLIEGKVYRVKNHK